MFVELPRYEQGKHGGSYNDNLAEFTADCQNVGDAVKLVQYNKKSLSKLISRYNNCELKPFPSFKYGIVVGYGMTKLFPSSKNEYEYLDRFNYKYEGGMTVGLFIDNPLFVSDFSLHAEVYYSQNGFSYNHRTANQDIDIVVNTSTLNVPLLIRYTLPTLKMRPFVNAGGIYTYHFKNENVLYAADIEQDVITINKVSETAFISENRVGFSLGGGLEYKLNYKRAISVELRYNKTYGISDTGFLNSGEFQLITGINL